MGLKNWPRGAWSHSRWTKLRTCPRAHNLRYEQKIYRIGLAPLPLEIGIGFHRGLEHVGEIATWGAETSVEDWEEASRKARQAVKDPKAGIEATRLLGAYHLKYGAENAGYGEGKVVAVEEVLLGGDLHESLGGFAAIADAVVDEPDGTRVIYEHKALSRTMLGANRTSDDVVQELKTGSQACALAFCGRAMWGVLPVVVRNVATKTNRVSLERYRITFTDAELDRWEDEQRELEQMVGLTCANRDACAPEGRGWKCDYFDWCYGTDEAKEQFYKKGKEWR